MIRMTTSRVSVFLFIILFVAGCELVTEQASLPIISPANHLVINEVYTMSLTEPSTYTWIEFYNPTADSVDLTGWTLNYSTFRLREMFVVQIDTNGDLVAFISATGFVDSIGRFDVEFSKGHPEDPREIEPPVILEPGGLYTLVNDEDRLLDHIQWGPGDERFREERELMGAAIDTIWIIPDTTQDTLLTVVAEVLSYALFFDESEELILKDPTGTAVDVVRFGNYTYSGTGSDPYPNNASFGFIPPFQSIQRYAGAFKTGNTENDFYTSSSDLVPTPHWLSLRFKE